jgi:hypothetical protein
MNSFTHPSGDRQSAAADDLDTVVAGLYRLPWPSSLPPVTGCPATVGRWRPLGRRPRGCAAAATVSVGAANQRRRLRIAQLIERRGRGHCSPGPRRLRRQSQDLPGCCLR